MCSRRLEKLQKRCVTVFVVKPINRPAKTSFVLPALFVCFRVLSCLFSCISLSVSKIGSITSLFGIGACAPPPNSLLGEGRPDTRERRKSSLFLKQALKIVKFLTSFKTKFSNNGFFTLVNFLCDKFACDIQLDNYKQNNTQSQTLLFFGHFNLSIKISNELWL